MYQPMRLVLGAMLATGLAVAALPAFAAAPQQDGGLTPDALASKRSYVIVGAFIIGMFLMPDVISQTLLALPMWFLFEVGIFISRLLLRRRQEARTEART